MFAARTRLWRHRPSLHRRMVSALQAPTRVLVVGGSYGGLTAALNLHDLCHGKPRSGRREQASAPATEPQTPVHITIVDERDGFFHLIAAPLALASEEYARKPWLKFSDIPALQHPDISCLQGSVTSLDPLERIATIKSSLQAGAVQHKYDYLVAASGLRRVWPTVPQSLTKKQYLFEAQEHIRSIVGAKERVVVVGGGAVGVEMAAELKHAQPHVKVTLVHSRDWLLSSEPLPRAIGEQTRLLLEDNGVEVILGQHVVNVEPMAAGEGNTLQNLTLADGSHILASKYLSAVSRPVSTATYLPHTALNEEGLVRVNNRLQLLDDIPNRAYHFAVGDMIAWSGIKRCGAAMYEASMAANNIHQQIIHGGDTEACKFEELPPIVPMLAMTVGNTAIAYSPDAGITHGVKVLEDFYENDVALDMICRSLVLGVEPTKDAKGAH